MFGCGRLLLLLLLLLLFIKNLNDELLLVLLLYIFYMDIAFSDRLWCLLILLFCDDDGGFNIKLRLSMCLSVLMLMLLLLLLLIWFFLFTKYPLDYLIILTCLLIVDKSLFVDGICNFYLDVIFRLRNF